MIFAARLVATINTRRFGDPFARNGLQTGPKNNLMIESPRIWIGMVTVGYELNSWTILLRIGRLLEDTPEYPDTCKSQDTLRSSGN